MQLTFQIPETIKHVSLGVNDDIELSRAMQTMIQIQQTRVRKGIPAQVETNIEEAPLASINPASLLNEVTGAFQDDNVVTSKHEVGNILETQNTNVAIMAVPHNINASSQGQNVALQSTSTLISIKMATETCCDQKETRELRNVQEPSESADHDALQWLQKNAHEDGKNVTRSTKILALAYSYNPNAVSEIEYATEEVESTYSEDWIEETPEVASPPNPPCSQERDKIALRHHNLESEWIAEPVRKSYQTCSIHGPVDLIKNAMVIHPPKRCLLRPLKESTHHHHQHRMQQAGDLSNIATMMGKHGYTKIRPFHRQLNGPKVATIEHPRLTYPPLLSPEEKVLETYKVLGDGKQRHLNEFDANMGFVKKPSELNPAKSRFNKIKDQDLHKMVDDIMILKSEEASLLNDVLRSV